MSLTLTDPTKTLMQIIEGRHSGRAYDTTRPVTQDHIQLLIEAARWTPSCYGEEPWRFMFCQKSLVPDQTPAYDVVLQALAESNQKWASRAPVLIVVMADTRFRKNQTLNRWGPYDTGAAAQTMMLAAHAQGLMLHPMGGFDAHQITQAFGISSRFEIMAVMALGYEDSSSLPPSSRTRQPVETRFFFDTWREE